MSHFEDQIGMKNMTIIAARWVTPTPIQAGIAICYWSFQREMNVEFNDYLYLTASARDPVCMRKQLFSSPGFLCLAHLTFSHRLFIRERACLIEIGERLVVITPEKQANHPKVTQPTLQLTSHVHSLHLEAGAFVSLAAVSATAASGACSVISV